MKKALVTGASEGIGRVFARLLAAEGFQVTLVARNESKLKDAVKECGQGHTHLVADLSTSEGQKTVCQRLNQEHFDLLVNNAGVGTVGGFTEVPVERQLAMVRLNCEAVVSLSHAFLENSKAGDALINVSSTLAFLPAPTLGLYCATKAFVTSFSESLWFEQKKRGVFVMDLCPGITSTSFQVNAGGKADDVPQNMAQTPETVVRVALRALKARKSPTHISGAQNSMMAGLARFIPRRSTVSMMGKMMSR